MLTSRLIKVIGLKKYLIGKERNQFTVAEHHEYKKIDRINSIKSSMKSHP